MRLYHVFFIGLFLDGLVASVDSEAKRSEKHGARIQQGLQHRRTHVRQTLYSLPCTRVRIRWGVGSVCLPDTRGPTPGALRACAASWTCHSHSPRTAWAAPCSRPGSGYTAVAAKPSASERLLTKGFRHTGVTHAIAPCMSASKYPSHRSDPRIGFRLPAAVLAPSRAFSIFFFLFNDQV